MESAMRQTYGKPPIGDEQLILATLSEHEKCFVMSKYGRRVGIATPASKCLANRCALKTA